MSIIYDMSMQDYLDHPAISRSHLKKLDVPALSQVDDSTNAGQSMGVACHTAVLEPHLFESSVIESSWKTANAKGHVALMEAHPEKAVLFEGGIEQVKKIAEAVHKHPFAHKLLSDPDNIIEPTILWTDEETGIECKTRPDIMNPKKQIFVDAKFVREGYSNPNKFKWYVRDYGYDLQVAMNIWGMKKASGCLYEEFWFVVCETVEPYTVACFQFDEEDISNFMYQMKERMAIEAACRKSGVWPNYRHENREGETLMFF